MEDLLASYPDRFRRARGYLLHFSLLINYVFYRQRPLRYHICRRICFMHHSWSHRGVYPFLKILPVVVEAGACHITYCQRATFSKWSRTELFLFHGENPRHRSPLFNRSIIARIGRDKPVMLMLPYAVWMYLSFATDSPWRSSIMLYFYCLFCSPLALLGVDLVLDLGSSTIGFRHCGQLLSVSYLQACGPRPTRAQVGFSRKVAKQQHNKRVKISASEIIYSKEDDNAIDEYHRRAVEAT